MKVRLKVLNDLSRPGTEDDPLPIVVKRNVVTHYYVYPQDIMFVGEVLAKDGRVYKGRCRLACRELGEVVVKHSVEAVRKMAEPPQRITVKGFKLY